MNIEKKDIEQYLSEVKKAVGNDRYRVLEKEIFAQGAEKGGVPFMEEEYRKDDKG